MRRDVVVLLGFRGFQVVAGFLFSMVITNLAGIAVFGRYSEIFAVVSVLMTLAALSVGHFSMFRLAGEQDRGQIEDFNRTTSTSIAIASLTCMTAYLAYVLATGFDWLALGGGLLIVALQPQIFKYQGILRATGSVKAAYVFDQVARPVLTLVIVAAITLGTEAGAGLVMAGAGLGYLVAAWAAKAYSERRLSSVLPAFPFRIAWNRASFLHQLRFTLPQVFGVISANIAVLTSSIYATDEISAQLRLIFQYASVLFLVHLAVQAQIAERIRIDLREGETARLQALVNRQTRLSVLLNLPLFLGLAVFGADVIELLHGVAIPQGALILFAGALYFETAFGPKAPILFQADCAGLISRCVFFGLSGFLVILLLLGPAGGAGPLYAIVIAYAVNTVIMSLSMAYLVYRRTGVRLGQWWSPW